MRLGEWFAHTFCGIWMVLEGVGGGGLCGVAVRVNMGEGQIGLSQSWMFFLLWRVI